MKLTIEIDDASAREAAERAAQEYAVRLCGDPVRSGVRDALIPIIADALKAGVARIAPEIPEIIADALRRECRSAVEAAARRMYRRLKAVAPSFDPETMPPELREWATRQIAAEAKKAGNWAMPGKEA